MPVGENQSSPEKKAFAQALSKLRAERGVTQEALAAESGYHPKYISLLEQGRYSPSLTTILELSQALYIPASELVSRVEKLLPKNRRRRRETREIR